MKFKEAGKWTGLGLLVVIGVPLIGAAFTVYAVFLSGWVTDITANRAGETEKKQLVEGSGQFRIQAYTFFKSTCAATLTADQNIETMEAEKQDPATDPTRVAFLTSAITAQTNQLNSLINEYNARSSSGYTYEQFRDNDLPGAMEYSDGAVLDTESQMEVTQCGD